MTKLSLSSVAWRTSDCRNRYPLKRKRSKIWIFFFVVFAFAMSQIILWKHQLFRSRTLSIIPAGYNYSILTVLKIYRVFINYITLNSHSRVANDCYLLFYRYVWFLMTYTRNCRPNCNYHKRNSNGEITFCSCDDTESINNFTNNDTIKTLTLRYI